LKFLSFKGWFASSRYISNSDFEVSEALDSRNDSNSLETRQAIELVVCFDDEAD
jgi:hypothetical protein